MTQDARQFDTSPKKSGSKNAWIALFIAVIGIYLWQYGPFAKERTITINIPLIHEGAGVEFGDSVGWDQGIIAEARETGKYIGCGDSLFFIEKEVSRTDTPISAVYEHLFQQETPVMYDGEEYLNPLTYQTEERIINEKTFTPLQFESVEIQNGIAEVRLSGDYLTIGTCEPPQTEAVLQFAALQFPQVDEVRIYINDRPAEFIHGGRSEEGL